MSSGNPETRQRILEVTWKLMAESRGQAVLVDDIARAAKLSRQSVYLHFGSRADLLIATVRYVDEVLELNQRIARICSSPRGEDILDGTVEFWGNYIPRIYGLAKALLAAYDTDTDAAAAWNDRMTAFRAGCRTAMQTLSQEQRLSPGWQVEEAADLMWSLLGLSTWENLTLRLGWSNEAYITHMQQVLRRAFISNSSG